MGRTAPLTFKRCILYIYSTNIGTEYFKYALYSPFFLSSKCSLFHNANLFGSCIIHSLYTGCAKIKKKFRRQRVNLCRFLHMPSSFRGATVAAFQLFVYSLVSFQRYATTKFKIVSLHRTINKLIINYLPLDAAVRIIHRETITYFISNY